MSDKIHEAFEAANPIPEGVARYRDGYLLHTTGTRSPAFSFIKAGEFIAKFAGYKEGWQAALTQQPAPVNKSVIRDVFMRNGFTIKEGQTDLKPYVYAAAEELLSLDGKAVVAEQPAPVAVPDECPHMIVFDDADREPLVFAGSGARNAALKVWEQISNSWNAHLFVRIERNSRDDRYPSPTATAAPAAPVAVGQEPVAWSVSVVWSGRRMPLGTHVVWWADETYRIEPSPESQDWPKVMQVSAEVYAKHHAAFLNSLDPSNAAVAVPLYTAPPAAEQPPKAPMHPGVHYGRCPHTLATNSACRECRDKYGAGFDYRQPSAAEQPDAETCPLPKPALTLTDDETEQLTRIAYELHAAMGRPSVRRRGERILEILTAAQKRREEQP